MNTTLFETLSTDGIGVEVDGEGNVSFAASGRWVGRTPQKRAPRSGPRPDDAESLEVRDLSDRIAGWVAPSADGLTFRLVPNRFLRAVQLDELDRIVGTYRAAPNSETLFVAATAARQLLGLASQLEAAEERRLAALVGQLTDLVVHRIGGLQTSVSTAAGESTDADFRSVTGTGAALFSSADVATAPELARLIEQARFALEQLQVQLRAAGASAAPALAATLASLQRLLAAVSTASAGALGIAGPALGSAALIVLIEGILFYGFAAAAAAGAAAGILAQLEIAVRDVIDLVGAARAQALRIAERLKTIDLNCIRRCFAELTADVTEAYADITGGSNIPGSGIALAIKLREAIDKLLNCLINHCKLPAQLAEAIIVNLKRTIRDRPSLSEFRHFPDFFYGGLSIAALIAASPRIRNGLRELALSGIPGGYHRKGGFAFEEFDDDREAAPDIADENPREDVDPATVNIDPNLDLGTFECTDLLQRFTALKTRLGDLVGDRDGLVADIRALAGSTDPHDRDRLQRLLPALDTVRQEINSVAIALYNVTLEMSERPCDELSRQEVESELESIRRIQRGNQSVPNFGQ